MPVTDTLTGFIADAKKAIESWTCNIGKLPLLIRGTRDQTQLLMRLDDTTGVQVEFQYSLDGSAGRALKDLSDRLDKKIHVTVPELVWEQAERRRMSFDLFHYQTAPQKAICLDCMFIAGYDDSKTQGLIVVLEMTYRHSLSRSSTYRAEVYSKSNNLDKLIQQAIRKLGEELERAGI